MKHKRVLVSLIVLCSAATVLFLGWFLSTTGGSSLKRITIESSMKPTFSYMVVLENSYAGSWFSESFSLMNVGTTPYTLTISVRGLPEGWNATSDYSGAAISPGETVGVTVSIHVGHEVPVEGLPVEVIFTPFLVQEGEDNHETKTTITVTF